MLSRTSKLVAAGAFASAAGLYRMLNREHRSLDDATRSALGGDYVRLRDGVTHYALGGPEDGPLVALIHGGTVPMWAWDAQVEPLHAAGLRTLRYDLFGRGYSDRPEVEYDRDLYRRQLFGLLRALEIDAPVSLVGTSMGAAIAASFAVAHPERVERVALIAPVVDYLRGRSLLAWARRPLIGTLLMRAVGTRAAEARAARFLAQIGAAPELAERFSEQMTFKGMERSMLSMLRSDALEDHSEVYRRLGAMETPVEVIWGTQDEEIPEEDILALAAAIPQAVIHRVEGGSHAVQLDHAEAVNAALIDFLAGSA